MNVASPDLGRFPEAARARAIEVRVRPGEMLYLPALWYHQVTACHACTVLPRILRMLCM